MVTHHYDRRLIFNLDETSTVVDENRTGLMVLALKTSLEALRKTTNVVMRLTATVTISADGFELPTRFITPRKTLPDEVRVENVHWQFSFAYSAQSWKNKARFQECRAKCFSLISLGCELAPTSERCLSSMGTAAGAMLQQWRS